MTSILSKHFQLFLPSICLIIYIHHMSLKYLLFMNTDIFPLFCLGALLQLSGDNLSELETSFSKLEVNVGRASGFTASNCKVAVNSGYTATVPVPFMRPPLLVDLMQLSVS